jgi:hypothetical protein
MRALLPGAIVALSALAALPAQSTETSYDFVACSHGRHTVVEAGADLVALGVENWGVVASSTTKEWEGATTHCVGYVRVVSGKPVGKGVCKWFQAGGDTAVGEFEYPPAGEPVFTWLSGTGRFKGIKGAGSFKELFTGKPAEPGTAQGCRHDWGRYVLP